MNYTKTAMRDIGEDTSVIEEKNHLKKIQMAF